MCAAECRRVRGIHVGAAQNAYLWDFCGARGGGRRRLTRPGIPEVRAVSAIGELVCLGSRRWFT